MVRASGSPLAATMAVEADVVVLAAGGDPADSQKHLVLALIAILQ
jgi:hypothetical protein